VLFLLLFTSSFAVEYLVNSSDELYQSELVDFEGDEDSEEDSKDEQEKESKILADLNMHLSQNTQLIFSGHIVLNGPSPEMQELTSPPPELS
jgi:hypothetical protein